LLEVPAVRPYWNTLDAAIRALAQQPKPLDVRKVGVILVHESDAICADTGAAFKVSDLIGLNPVPLTPSQAHLKAREIFVETTRSDIQGALVRTFLRRGHVLVGAQLVVGNPPYGRERDLDSGASDFAAKRGIEILFLR